MDNTRPLDNDILFPFARRGGEVVHIRSTDGEVLAGEEFCCLGCGELMVPKRGDELAWHFAHKANLENVAGCTEAETALHLNAKHGIQDGFARRQGFYVLTWWCRGGCREERNYNLADLADRVEVEAQLDGFRPDLLFYKDDEPVLAIEVVVSNPVSGDKAQLYGNLGLPYLEVTPQAGDDFQAGVRGSGSGTFTPPCRGCESLVRHMKMQVERGDREERRQTLTYRGTPELGMYLNRMRMPEAVRIECLIRMDALVGAGLKTSDRQHHWVVYDSDAGERVFADVFNDPGKCILLWKDKGSVATAQKVLDIMSSLELPAYFPYESQFTDPVAPPMSNYGAYAGEEEEGVEP